MNTISYLEGEPAFGSIYASSSFSSQKPSFTEGIEYSTIDGGVITHTDCEHAVSNGSGIFIGEYFVGLTESHHFIGGDPFIKY